MKKNNSPISQQMISASVSGPLPLAEQFDKYEKVLPGAADRILTMAEKEQDFYFQIQRSNLEEQTKNAENLRSCNLIAVKTHRSNLFLQYFCAYSFALIVFFVGCLFLYHGQAITGFSVITPILGVIIYGFIKKEKLQSKTNPTISNSKTNKSSL